MLTHIKQFLKEEDGITALEYGLLAAVVAGALVLVFKDRLEGFFTLIMDELETAVTDATS